jgi:hypothetical protein
VWYRGERKELRLQADMVHITWKRNILSYLNFDIMRLLAAMGV